MAWTTNPYCQLGDVKLALGTTSSQTADDTWLQELIGEAQQTLDTNIGYAFQTDGTVGSPATRLYDGSGFESLAIDDCLQLVQVIETTYFPQVSSQGLWMLGQPQTIDITADCVLQPNNVLPATLLRRLSSYEFAQGLQNYTVKGIFGFSSIPADITRACIRLTTFLYKQRAANYSDAVADKQFGRGLKFITSSLPEEVLVVIDKYRHRLFLAR